MHRSFIPFFLSLLACLSLSACALAPAPFKSSAGSTIDIEEAVVWRGDDTSNTVVLIAQGGPEKELGILKDGRTRYRYIPGYDDYSIGYVHQAQTLDAEIWKKGMSFSKQDAHEAMDLSVSMLTGAAANAKSKGKRVVVIGHSYGAFLVLKGLTEKGVFADKIIVSAGRLQIPPAMMADHASGVTGSFAEDGSQYLPYVADGDDATEAERSERHIRNLIKWAADVRPTLTKIEELDLTGVSIFYAKNDQNVGKLTEEEITALETAGAQVFANDRGHSATLYAVVDAIEDGEITLP